MEIKLDLEKAYDSQIGNLFKNVLLILVFWEIDKLDHGMYHG